MFFKDRGCTNRQGWQPHGHFISSGINHGDDVYLVLTLKTKGFGAPQSKRGIFGEISFTFELECHGDCVFRFKQVSYGKDLSSVLSSV